MINLISWLLLFLTLAKGSVYDQTIDCSLELTDEQLQEGIHLYDIDSWIFLFGAPIAFFCTIFITSTFLLYPKTRKMPGDIMFMISISDCLLSCHWFSHSVYYRYYGRSPQMNGDFCQTNAFIAIFAATGEFAYNCAFCLYLYMTISNVLKINKRLRLIVHVLSIGAMILVPTLAMSLNLTGLNLFGTCSFRQKAGFPYAGIMLVFVYTIVSLYTIYHFKKTVPDTQETLVKKQDFTNYYFKYVCASCIIWSGLAIANLIAALNCIDFHEAYLNIFITVGNMLKLCTPIVLSILRYKDPIIKSKVQKLIRRISGNSRSTRVASEDSDSRLSGQNWLETLTSKQKQLQIYTYLYGICHVYEFYEDSVTSQPGQFNIQRRNTEMKQRTLSMDKSDQQFLYNMYNLTQKDVDEETTRTLTSDDKKVIPMNMITYGEKLFQKIVEKDEIMCKPTKSFDPEENSQQIQSFMGPDGGSGGEFFFFSFDNRLIIKTITETELKAFRSRLTQYGLHLLSDQTMISPIYGLFTFVRDDLEHQSTNILIMKNIAQIERQYFLRCYDIKGSDVSREVISNGATFTEEQLRKKTLKDVDFMKLEVRVDIDFRVAKQVQELLIRDANFFKKVKLMDYSLLIMKIDWRTYCKEKNINENTIQDRFSSELYCIPSIVEKGIYYHIGIIDYLQEWNNAKILEQKGKKLFKGNQNLNISAQEPNTYADRFIQEVALKIF